jgi:RNA polymerase sigma factor (sigma-70 family)
LRSFLRKKTKQHTDAQLIELYKSSKDTFYVGELFQRYSHLIASLAFNYLKNSNETEDAVMDVFEIMTRDLRIHDVKNFNAWIYSVTKNHSLKLKRKRNKERDQEEGLKHNGHDLFGSTTEEDKERSIAKDEQLNSLEEALKTLSEEQKRCVELFYLNNKSYTEVADETGFTMKQVKSYLQNGKRNLKGHLTKL